MTAVVSTGADRMSAAGAVASAGAGVLCFSGTAVATRAAAPALGSVTLTFARIVIAAALSLVALRTLGPPWLPDPRRLPSLLVMGAGLAVGFPLLLAVAVERVPASHAAVVLGIAPAATACVSALRTGERLPARFWAGCATGFATVVAFAVWRGGGTLRLADLWLLAAVLSVAIGYVEGGSLAREVGGTRSLAWAMLVLAPVAAAALSISMTLDTPTEVPAGAWLGAAYAGTFSMFVGSVLWYRGLAAGGVARLGQLNLAQPLLAIGWSALLLGEHIDWSLPATALAVLACLTICLRVPESEVS
jgi:drug/metabolite transporter (DMT)-like permease